MREVFEVELASENGCTELTLPAAPYAMLDALDKLRLAEGEALGWELLRTYDAGRAFQHLDQENGTLAELNALAQRLAQLDEPELTIFEGLAAMEPRPLYQPFPLSRLIDMAYSTDRCHLVEAGSEEELGRFYVEDGFLPEFDGLPDSVLDRLDYGKIGREFRQGEADVFISGGYVLRHSELAQAYKTLDLTLKKPDYTILAETAGGHEVSFPFPANEPMGTEPVRCVDCAAPALIGISGGMERMNLLARRLSGMEETGKLPKFKALLDAAGCRELETALLLADSLDRYVFAPELRTPEDVARANLNVVMPDDEVEFMARYLDLSAYGRALVKQGGGTLTGYGLIERVDGQSMQMPEEKQELQGMELQ